MNIFPLLQGLGRPQDKSKYHILYISSSYLRWFCLESIATYMKTTRVERLEFSSATSPLHKILVNITVPNGGGPGGKFVWFRKGFELPKSPPLKVSKCPMNYTKHLGKLWIHGWPSDSSTTSQEFNTSNAPHLEKTTLPSLPNQPAPAKVLSLLGRLGSSFPAEMGSPTMVLVKITRSCQVRLPWWP